MLVLIRRFLNPEPSPGVRSRVTETEFGFFQNKSCDAAGNCGGSIGRVQTRKKKNQKNRTKKNKAKRARSEVWCEFG